MKNGPELREMLQRWYSCPEEVSRCVIHFGRPNGLTCCIGPAGTLYQIDGCEQYLDRPPGVIDVQSFLHVVSMLTSEHLRQDQGAFDDYFIHPLLDAGKIALAPCAEATGSETEGPRTKW